MDLIQDEPTVISETIKKDVARRTSKRLSINDTLELAEAINRHEKSLRATDDAGINEFAKLKEASTFKLEDHLTLIADEYAIVGFWRKDENDRFVSYHFFRVPNPVKRSIREDEG